MHKRRAVLALLLLFAAGSSHAAEWTPFTIRAYDGREAAAELHTMAVPENRGDANARLIRVAVVRLPAREHRGAAPVVFLTGGPGVPATALARVPPYFNLFDKLRTT